MNLFFNMFEFFVLRLFFFFSLKIHIETVQLLKCRFCLIKENVHVFAWSDKCRFKSKALKFQCSEIKPL